MDYVTLRTVAQEAAFVMRGLIVRFDGTQNEFHKKYLSSILTVDRWKRCKSDLFDRKYLKAMVKVSNFLMSDQELKKMLVEGDVEKLETFINAASKWKKQSKVKWC